MTDLSRNIKHCLKMPMIYLNAAHTPSSPGGVYKGKNEHAEALRFCKAVREKLLLLDSTLDVGIVTGKINCDEMLPDSLIFVFHKGTNEKNENKSGADILVKQDASAAHQYRAYRLLCAMCGENALKYRGVHTAPAGSPFSLFVNTATEDAYLIRAGFIESDEDNRIFDKLTDELAYGLSKEIINIYKEKINEDHT